MVTTSRPAPTPRHAIVRGLRALTRGLLRHGASRLLLVLVVAAFAAAPRGVARADAPAAASARGLDVLVAGARSAAPGAPLAVAIRVVGYRTVLRAEAIEGASVELAWDTTNARSVPPPVQVRTDADGAAAATVIMPVTDEAATLFVTARHGARARTRTVAIAPLAAVDLDVIVPDTEVVPGSRVGAWLRVRDRAEGRRLAGVRLIAEMIDGGVTRQRVSAITDGTGSALVFLRAPELPAGAKAAWSLRAALTDGAAARAIPLAPREEVPAQPDLEVAWERDAIEAGAATTAIVRLRDASGEPLAGQRVEHVVTALDPDGETPDAWEAAHTTVTDGDGRVAVPFVVPPVLPAGAATYRIAARTTVFERVLERSDDLPATSRGGAVLEAIPEAGALVPGVPQRVFLRARGDDGAPITGAARALADGLAVDVELDARGEGEIAWTPPPDVGSRRAVGPCARSVAATITLEDAAGRLARGGGRAFACVVVDRAREAMLQVEPPLARAGERVQVRLVSRAAGAAASRAVVVLAPREPELGAARAVWIDDAAAGAEVTLPAGPPGAWSVGVFVPRDGAPALGATTSILVAPRVLPRVSARVVGGRIAPGGEVEVEARLVDETGAPIDGLVAGLVFDAFGGGTSERLERLDTRVVLCEAAGLDGPQCPAVWSGGARAAALLRSGLASLPAVEVARPLLDPGATASEELEAAFAATLRSLEGAVFEATTSPARLVDARRERGGDRTFNPELFHIVTASLASPPTTPGGEPITLADLVAVDPQVRFDVVARRVTRLKVFRVLEQVRSYRHTEDLDLGEPALADPDALLARLTAGGALEPSALLDPWGGTLGFRRAAGGGRAAPTIASLPGWELASPGPDRRAGTADDVVDPFARIVASGTPYARALDEDAIVLARDDVRIGEATVSAWSSLLERNTGTTLGDATTGTGHGRLSGSHKTRSPSLRMGATMVDRRPREPAWALPTRTRGGVVRLRLPLGAVDTTYRVVVVGLADGGEPAVTLIDVPITTPIAARIEAGERWVEGDAVEVAVRVRNRTAARAELVASIGARGGAVLADGAGGRRALVVPPRGSAIVHAMVRAARAGDGIVEVTLRDAAGRAVDAVRTTVPIALPGRRIEESRARWVDGTVDIPALSAGPGERALGPMRLVVEGGVRETLSAALRALEPDHLVTPDALVDALETASRVALYAVEAPPHDDGLADRARGVVARARGRLGGRELDVRSPEVRRAQLFTDLPRYDRAAAPCGDDAPPLPPVASTPRGRDVTDEVRRAIALLEAEPAASVGASSSCWESVASETDQAVGQRGDVLELARLVLAYAERRHRRDQANTFAVRLARVVGLRAGGRVALPAPHGERREARAVVLAALLRASASGAVLPATREALRGWLLVQRDATGGFGSPAATRVAIAALVADAAHGGAANGGGRVSRRGDASFLELDEEGEPLGPPRRAPVGGATPLVLAAATAAVRVTAADGALVRLERAVLRPATPSAELLDAPLRLTVTWPARPRTDRPGVVQVVVHGTRSLDAPAFVRLPLPAGVSLDEAVEGVRMVPGALLVDVTAEADDTPIPRRIPVRFALAGDLAVPEASAHLAEEGGAAAHARAPRLVVRR